MMQYLYHVHLQNDMTEALTNLVLTNIWEELGPGQNDVVSLEPGGSVEFYANYPNYRKLKARFSAAVAAAGGTEPEVWWSLIESV